MDFAVLPPEINSARMYSGPGAEPMLTAAAAWDGLATMLSSAASSYGSVISGLTSGSWLGPASGSMAAAATPYVAWMNATAAQANQAATQAKTAASAYETAFAMTVPPPVIAANRAQLSSLVTTNVLGQNTPAIAATEAQYGAMWAQDIAAMDGYASTSAAATTVTPFTTPQSTANPAGLTGQAAAVTQASGTSAATNASTLSGLQITTPGSDTLTTGFAGILNDLSGTNGNPIGTILNGNLASNTSNAFTSNGEIAPYAFASTAAGLVSANGGTDAGGADGDGADSNPADGGSAPAVGEGAGPAADSGAGDAGLVPAAGQGLGPGAGALGSAVVPDLHAAAPSAEMGRANPVGPLSVPPNWPATESTISRGAAALPGTGPGAAPMVAAGGPAGRSAVPVVGLRRRRPVPKYGFRPVVMARPLDAGEHVKAAESHTTGRTTQHRSAPVLKNEGRPVRYASP